MDIHAPLPLLGGLSPAQFMQRHWQKKPLLVRQAVPGFEPGLTRADLMALAARDDVESRLIVHGAQGWRLRHGPLARRAFPPLAQKRWTFLVQGVDLHHPVAHGVLQAFRFVPDARLDDLMVSWASDGGGVGPHFDSYDVFLLQAQGRRRWRIGRQRNLRLQEGVPLKILAEFEPEQEFLLEPGDMLYLPPKWAHDGVAEGECMTWSVGFRAPAPGELAQTLLQGLADEAADRLPSVPYRDPGQGAVDHPAAIPPALHDFAQQALQRALAQPQVLALLLGEHLTEPKAQVWFEAGRQPGWQAGQGLVLDPRTRMMYDERHVFINGEGFAVSGRDARLLRALADARRLSPRQAQGLSASAQAAVATWVADGWAQAAT